MKRKNKLIDMTHGPITSRLIQFSVPVVISSFLQLLFNTMDIMVVGRFVGSNALAAVGSTGSLYGLLTNLAVGFAVGTNVIVARYHGQKDEAAESRAVHTAIMTSLILGVILIGMGMVISAPMLRVMDTPEEILDQSVLYMRIIFIGMPVVMLYNFGSGILRAVGDTKRPMYFLLTAGIINICLNLFFVLVCDMGVAGVAWATTISQSVSAVLVVMALTRLDGGTKLVLKRLHIYKKELLEVARQGIPAGIASTLFSISNILVQSTVNSFGATAVAGNSAATQIEGYLNAATGAFYQASLSFVSQNYGARKYMRIRKISHQTLLLVTMVGTVLGCLAVWQGRPLLRLFTSDEAVVEVGFYRVMILSPTYATCGLMNGSIGPLRGTGHSTASMLMSILGVCVFRLFWIHVIFPMNPTLVMLYAVYPTSWTVTFICQEIMTFFVFRKFPKEDMPDSEAVQTI